MKQFTQNLVIRYFIATQIIIASLFISSCSKSSDDAIESVLNDCADKSAYVNNSAMSAAKAAQYIALEMQKIDTGDCPPEFRTAFQQHINAWRNASGYFAQNTPLNAFLEGYAAGHFGDASLYGVSQRNAAMAIQNINNTYYALVNIAAKHGAKVPESTTR